MRLGPLTPHTLGAEVYRWEVTVALTCAILGVNPFDQPDVEAAKRAAGVSLAGGGTDIPTEAARSALDAVGAGGYVSIQAFVDPEDALVASLARARLALRDRLRVPVTLDLGPRYLHSTGQLHKGGPAGGVFLQVVDPGDDDLKVPGRDFSFGRLLRAQADGDYTALATLGRPIARTTTEDLLATTGF
ncbi:MAG: hypothetical protein M5T61_06725 [Acidimicrobiia bacterium]|nr:hypothetical protein [Acidimicrobiia bacterium]